jgi:hypothetical protein
MTGNQEHIYFLVHKTHERFKVGLAKHPLKRWAQIQPHSQTDFRESLVFDVAPEVSDRWVERTLPRSIADARLDLPGSLQGYTEWFDYRAFDSVRRFAAERGDFLGIGVGYTLAKPARPERTPRAQRRSGERSGLKSMFPVDAVASNGEVATLVEKWADRLLESESLIGTVVGKQTLWLFFCRERATIDQVWMHQDNSLISEFNLTPNGGGLVRNWIFGSARAEGTLIRLSLSLTFPFTRGHDISSWVQATPGIDRVWAAVSRLIASAPPLAAPPSGHLRPFRDGTAQ